MCKKDSDDFSAEWIGETMNVYGDVPAADPFAIPKGAVCANCGDRPATAVWSGEGGTLAVVHGFVAYWCEWCVLRAQIAYAEEVAGRLPELRAKLQALEGGE